MTRATDEVPFVDLAAQHDEIRTEVLEAMTGTLDRSDFILGADVAAFEEEFAAYCDAHHGVGVDSGLSALQLSLLALGVGSGDEVITVANTFVATALSIGHTGATPVLVDMDPATYQIDPNQVAAAITPRTKAVVPVHLYGQPAAMDPIGEIARSRGIAVVEDASQAHGARYGGRRVGSLGDAAAFSLYPAKNLGALGDAGVIVTEDGDLAERVRLLRNYGSPKKYVHEVEGFNHRLDTIHAAVLRAKLRRLDAWNSSRRANAFAYRTRLSDLEAVRLPPEIPDTEPVHHLFVIRTERRDDLQRYLGEHGIATVIHYPTPVHLLGAYRHLGLGPGSFPETERHAAECLSLPMYPHLEEVQIDRVCEAIREYFCR